jgi:hypothetical protein
LLCLSFFFMCLSILCPIFIAESNPCNGFYPPPFQGTLRHRHMAKSITFKKDTRLVQTGFKDCSKHYGY